MFLTLGGWLADIDWRLPFLIYVAPLLLLPLVVLSLPRQAVSAGAVETDTEESSAVAQWARLLGIYLLAIAAMAFFYVVPTQLPFRLASAGFEDATLSGYAIAASTFASASTALLFRRIKASIPAVGALALIFLGLGAGLLAAGALDSFAFILVAMLIAGAGAGLTMPVMNSLVLDTASARLRGRATGGLSTSIFLGQFLSPILVSVLVRGETVVAIFAWAGGAALLFAAVFTAAFVAHRFKPASPSTEKET